jgi:hypothetical protein
MAAKKKAKKKSTAKKIQKRRVTPKKSTQKRSRQRKAAPKRAAKRVAKDTKAPKKRVPPTKQKSGLDFSGSRKLNTSSGDQDSQGLSEVESVDSESVSELLDEGNTFEAGVVKGVEEADDSDGKEVRTREFPEDDVPEEYLDQD